MKRLVVVCFLALLVVFFLGIEGAKAEEKDVSFLAYTEILSQYVSSNGPAVALDKPIWVTGLCASFRNGMFIYLTNASDLKWEETYGNEVDVQGGWAGKVGPLEMRVMTEYFDIIPLPESNGDTIQFRAMIGKTFFVLSEGNSIRPYIMGKVQFPVGPGNEEREIYFLGLDDRWTLERFTIAQTVQVFHNTSLNGTLGDYAAEVSFEILGNLAIYGKFRIVSALNEDTRASKKAETVSGGGIRFAF